MENVESGEPLTGDAIEHPTRRPYPSKLFVEVTTRCNLRCAMCLKQAPGSGIVEGDMSDETFARLAPAFPHLETLILNGIGEPLLHPRLEQFAERAKSAMPASGTVGFQTNGHLLTRERARSLARAGIDRVCLSSDAVSEDVFQTVRQGGTHESIEAAVASLHDAMRQEGRRMSIGVEFVVMQDNVHELPPLLHWAAQRNLGFVIVTQMLPYHKAKTDNVAFDLNTDVPLQIFQEWKTKAAADGVDIGRYLEIFMKYSRTPEEDRIVDYVEKMKADAWARGIPMNPKSLPRRNEPMLQRVKEAFAEAEEIATRNGIELHLPATKPTRARRCEFVEEGGAFISWDGKVHPCYFLWHRYRCYLGGVEKFVKPQSFGHLMEQDIHAIWNSEAFTSFRGAVVKYDFPFCYDCTFALCDYAQLEDFMQDCYVSTVPCGACMWCTGLFQCLR